MRPLRRHSLLLLVACGSKPTVASDPRLPFAIDLTGYQRVDAGTVATYRLGDRVVQIVPRIMPATDEQLDQQIERAAHVLDPKAVQTARNGHQLTFGNVEALGQIIDGYVVIRACKGPPHGFFDPLPQVQPDQGFTVEGGLRIPKRGWYVAASSQTNANVFILPEMHATLGIRHLHRKCDDLAGDPAELVASVSELTIATTTRTATGVRAVSKDDRPAVLEIVCRDGDLVEVMMRGSEVTPAMTAMLDQVIQPAGSAMRDDKSSSERAQ